MTDIASPTTGEPSAAPASATPPTDPAAALAALQVEEQERYGTDAWRDPEFLSRRDTVYRAALGDEGPATATAAPEPETAPEPAEVPDYARPDHPLAGDPAWQALARYDDDQMVRIMADSSSPEAAQALR